MKAETSVMVDRIVGVLEATVLSHRHRWATFTQHGRGYEAWWKLEFALALESWVWSSECDGLMGVRPEAKPRDFGFGGDSKAVDLLVAPWDLKTNTLKTADGPRIWIELKERADWWGAPEKALGFGNHGYLHDLSKWKDVFGASLHDDVLICCHLLSHTGKRRHSLPPGWNEPMENLRSQYQARKTYYAGMPIGDDQVRWLTLDAIQVFPPE